MTKHYVMGSGIPPLIKAEAGRNIVRACECSCPSQNKKKLQSGCVAVSTICSVQARLVIWTPSPSTPPAEESQSLKNIPTVIQLLDGKERECFGPGKAHRQGRQSEALRRQGRWDAAPRPCWSIFIYIWKPAMRAVHQQPARSMLMVDAGMQWRASSKATTSSSTLCLMRR